jgi:hypothetical protein
MAMAKQKSFWSPEHEAAFQEVVRALRPPELAIPNMRKKYKRIKWSAEQIKNEADYFKQTGNDYIKTYQQ